MHIYMYTHTYTRDSREIDFYKLTTVEASLRFVGLTFRLEILA